MFKADTELSREKLLECELWLLALYWGAGWNLPWEFLHRWVEEMVRSCPIRARA